MAIVHHHMIGQIGPRPLQPRVRDSPELMMDKAIKRALRGSFSHFNQFKIEPLLRRNAPTVEVSTLRQSSITTLQKRYLFFEKVCKK